MSKSRIGTIIFVLITLGFIVFIPPFLIIGVPLLLIITPNLILGYKSHQIGLLRIAISIAIGFISGLIFLFLIRNFCGIDGGDPCQPTVVNYILTGLAVAVIGIPIMYVGVLIKYLFKDPV